MNTAGRDKGMQPLLEVGNLVKTYSRRRLAGSGEGVRALDGVSFSIFRGTTLAIVGESGSGKSTLASCLACLEKPTSGAIRFEDKDIVTLSEEDLRAIRRQMQLIFQDPASSFNPRWGVGEILIEPLALQGNLGRDEMRTLVIRSGKEERTIVLKEGGDQRPQDGNESKPLRHRQHNTFPIDPPSPLALIYIRLPSTGG